MNVESAQSPSLELRTDAHADNVMLVRQAIEGAARGLGVGGSLLNDVKLAVTEACSNVVKHAYVERPGEIYVRLSTVGSELTVEVRDFGQWREPPTGRSGDSNGVGLSLIEAVTARHQVDTGPSGTSVTLVFPLALTTAGAGDGG